MTTKQLSLSNKVRLTLYTLHSILTSFFVTLVSFVDRALAPVSRTSHPLVQARCCQKQDRNGTMCLLAAVRFVKNLFALPSSYRPHHKGCHGQTSHLCSTSGCTPTSSVSISGGSCRFMRRLSVKLGLVLWYYCTQRRGATCATSIKHICTNIQEVFAIPKLATNFHNTLMPLAFSAALGLLFLLVVRSKWRNGPLESTLYTSLKPEALSPNHQ